jgi:threonylcarbamoyladenosine tRNA methylthiotransferase MtaB
VTRPTVAFETLGCKLNQFETDGIAAEFLRLGWTIVDPGGAADAYVVNTCTVTAHADKKSRRTVSAHTPGPGVVVVTGCFAESARETLEDEPGVTFVVPNARKNQIAALVDSHRRGEVSAPATPGPDPFGFAVDGKVFHTRAGLKIQDGCDNFCSFCIIPSVRGRAVSRPRDAVLAAARSALQNGRKELVLTGINLGRWSDGTLGFTGLVRDLLAIDGDWRLRITSLEPALDEAFADLLGHPKLCPHLHLCLQSASPRVLLAMRREYNLEQYTALVDRLRARQPGLNLTTDLLVGFPGETDADFERSLEAVETYEFGFVHVFPYSRRQDTRADRMPGQVPEAVKAERSRRLQARADEARRQRMGALVGIERRVLVETPDQGRLAGGWLRGLTEDYFPVRFCGQTAWNTFERVRLSTVVREGGEWVFEAQAF